MGTYLKASDLALYSLHLPIGGERFRPCLEDFLQFLVVDCGVDHHEGWFQPLTRGRERWRRKQLAAVVRDVPGEAALAPRELGWTVTPPVTATVEKVQSLSKW